MRKIWMKCKQTFGDMKFRQKLMLTYFFIGIVPVIILGLFCFVQTKNILIEREKKNLSEYLSQSINNLDNQIEIYNNLSDYLAYNKTISNVVGYDYKRNFDMYDQYTKVLDPMLSSLRYFHNDLNKITIYTSNTMVKHDTTLDALDVIKKEPWYAKIQNNNPRTISWFVDAKRQKAFSVRKMKSLEENKIKGVLYLEMGSNHLFDEFSKLSNTNYGIYIQDDEGNVIYHYRDKGEDKNAKTLSLAQCQTGDQGYAIVSKKTSTGWTVWLYKPNSVIFSSIWSIILALILVIILCVIISTLAATKVSKILVSRIVKLKQNMTAVESGKMEILVTSNSKDEVGDLIRGFGKMITQINTLIEEVYKGELTQKEYEMKALQAQINPHFLYNSLSLINWKAIAANQPDISKLTLLLSTFYRTALNRGNNILSIRDEVSNMRSYLDIQLMMHDDNFDANIDIPKDIEEYATLNLILQPLIENAIDHGIDLKEDGRGLIKIYGYAETEDIYLIVEDNGIGMDQVKAKSIITEHSKGYGVRNVNERIQLLFGKEYGLNVESKLGQGTRIIIHMPKRML